MSDFIHIEMWGAAPVPQGSKSSRVVNGRAVMFEANKRTKPWRQALSALAEARVQECEWEMAIDKPIELRIVFIFPRPKAHYKSFKLRLTAPFYKRSKPDLDKLLRAVGDALTGIVYKDDAQVVRVHMTKRYTYGESTVPGVVISCATL